jgi:hypothetical protein
LRIRLVGFVVANGAAGRRANLAVSGHMARDSTDDRALDASLCLRGGRKGASGSQHGDANDEFLALLILMLVSQAPAGELCSNARAYRLRRRKSRLARGFGRGASSGVVSWTSW